EGVNAFIATLKPSTFPIEYKILGVSPEAWEPKNAGYLLKFMAWSLSGSSQDVPLSRSAHVLGKAAFQELFPLNLPVPEPIVPAGTKFATRSVAPEAPSEDFEPSVESLDPLPTPHPSNGSNNWAVTGKKSTTGLPILSNDIHLGLSLPALWYEMQLVSPTQNVYGIALPGAPGVILGFNESMAWGVTNGGDDVLDWYQLRFRDEKRSEYLYEGGWRPVISREVKMKVRGEAEPRVLLLRETHFGPIVYDNDETPMTTAIPKSLAMRWAALSESNELKNFMLLNKAKSVSECRKALDGYRTPAQNFLCVDNSGETALYHMGRYPLRFPGQGRLVSDGSRAKYDWSGWLTPDEIPFSKNPSRGFLSSANQPPTDSTYPFYLGWPYENLSRPTRINEILRSKQKFSPEDFVKMQRDNISVIAKLQTAPLLKALEGLDLDKKESKAIAALKTWDGNFESTSKAAPLAYAWFKQAEFNLWKRLLPERRTFYYPPLVKTIEVLSDPNS
ncbi:MAG: penicillin acylase family protein, partial [Proteobacteria bacterium]